MRITDLGWLAASDQTDPPIVAVESQRTTPLDVPSPLGLCWHWTAGSYHPDKGHLDSVALAKTIVERPPNKDASPAEVEAARRRGVSLASASWHAALDKDGAVVQSVPFTKGAWHVAPPGMVLGKQRYPNRCLIGIELENAGRLKAILGGTYAWPWYENPDAPPEQRKPAARYAVDKARAVPAKGGLFDDFTPEQERTAELLVRACVDRWKFPRAACSFGHRDFDSPRKEDPGPLWAEVVLPRILNRVFGTGG